MRTALFFCSSSDNFLEKQWRRGTHYAECIARVGRDYMHVSFFCFVVRLLVG